MKQKIEIDVPEGKEIDRDLINENNQEDPLTIFVIYFKDTGSLYPMPPAETTDTEPHTPSPEIRPDVFDDVPGVD